MAPSTPDPNMCALWEEEWQPFDQATGVEVAMGASSVQLRLRDGGRHNWHELRCSRVCSPDCGVCVMEEGEAEAVGVSVQKRKLIRVWG